MRLVTLFLVIVCQALPMAAQSTPPAEVRTYRDLVYAKAPEKDLLLDLFVPPRAKAVLVWIHGGAWIQGSKANCPAVPFTETGYAVACINYRLSPVAIFPAQIHDCKAAIRWIRANAPNYGYDGTRIGVWGSSAGGHLVSLLGTSGNVPSLEGGLGNPDQSSRVQAVVDFFGPTDLTAMSQHPSRMRHDDPDSPESRLVGGPIQLNKPLAMLANPITFITPDDPPFLIVHGDSDPLVPVAQSVMLSDALRANSVRAELRILSGAGHGGPQFRDPKLLTAIQSFLDENLKRR